jgi:hypothetical protein
MSCKVKGCAFPETKDGLCAHHLRDQSAGDRFLHGVAAPNSKPEPQPVRRSVVPTRCARDGCTYLAASGETYCIQHRTAKVPTKTSFEEDGYTFVDMKDVPTNARYNEAAGRLFAAVKACPDRQALKLSMKTFKKITLLTAQRYALAGGLRIGVRIVGETGYLWKLSESEIESVKKKGERMSAARNKKKPARGKAVSA